MRALTSLFLLATLIGCGSGASNNQSAANSAAPANTAAPTASIQLTPQWIAGHWQSDGPDACGAGDSAFSLEPGGAYAFMEEKGRWTLEGNKLTIEVTQASSDSGTEAGQKNSVEVQPIGPNEAEWRPQGQPPVRMYRCPA